MQGNGYVRQWAMLVAMLALLIGVAYAPSLTAYFICDDFDTVAHLFFAKPLLNDSDLTWFLLRSNDGGHYFRPVGQLMYLLDSLTWGLEPFGYHLTNLIFHCLTSFLAFLLSWRITRNCTTATTVMVLFSVLPVHAGAVSWIAARYDVICGTFYLGSVLFYVLYCQRGSRSFYLLSLGLFFLALGAKEVAFTLPFAIALYELVYVSIQRIDLSKSLLRQLAFWLELVFFIGFRLWLFGVIGYEAEVTVNDTAWWLDRTLEFILDPLALDMSEQVRWFFLGLCMLVAIAYRSRREVLLGLGWIPITFIATISSGASDRSFYIPSFGLVLVLGSIAARLSGRQSRLTRALGMLILLGLMLIYGVALFGRNQLYHRAGEVAYAIPQQVKALYPVLPPEARLFFVGVPDRLPSGILVYLTGFRSSMQITYRNRSLDVNRVGEFPQTVEQPDRAFFFLVDHRRVTDRTMLVQEELKRR